jgi:hypothetical protein
MTMHNEDYGQLIDSVMHTLTKNGYPDNQVALPLIRMYEVAHNKGLNFNKALIMLEERGVAHRKENDRLIFAKKVAAALSPEDLMKAFGNVDLTAIPPGQLRDLLAQASKLLEQMPPDEMDQLLSLYQNMSPAERDELAKKAADLTSGQGL